jgi:hypothetical protein
MAAGAAKHGLEPGFPSFFATNNLAARADQVAQAVLKANALKADERALAISVKQEAAEIRALYDRGIMAVEGFYGLSNPTLREFGVRPRKGADSTHVRGAKKARQVRRARKAAGSLSSGGAPPTNSPATSTSSGTGGSP